MSGWPAELVKRYARGRELSGVDRAAVKALFPSAGDTVLELGCGPGTAAAWGVRTWPKPLRLILTDVSGDFLPLAIEATAEYGEAFACAADPAAVPLRSGTVDRVLTMATLHHMSDGGLRQAFEEIARVICAKGRFVLVEDWAFEEPGDFETLAAKIRSFAGHRENHKSVTEWISLAASAGLGLESQQWVPRPFRLPERGAEGNDQLEDLLRKARTVPQSRRSVRMWMGVFRPRREVRG